MTPRCDCAERQHVVRLVAITGGPGAGKTALLETARRHLCSHVLVLPESAGIVFGGGFPRHDSAGGLRASQRAIFHIQREMERLVCDEAQAAIALCDRGTLDALAYWPGEPTEFWEEVSSSVEAELNRYIAVIHLEVPDATQGYERFSNRLRIESNDEARRIDERIRLAWQQHPNRFGVSASLDFLDKIAQGLATIRAQLPDCCREHV